MAWYDDPELRRGARALARMAFLQRFGSSNVPDNDPLGEYIDKKRAEKCVKQERVRNTHWTISWGTASASYFRGDEEEEMQAHVKWLLSKGYKLRAISKRRGGLFDEAVEIIRFDDPPKKLGGLWGFLED